MLIYSERYRSVDFQQTVQPCLAFLSRNSALHDDRGMSSAQKKRDREREKRAPIGRRTIDRSFYYLALYCGINLTCATCSSTPKAIIEAIRGVPRSFINPLRRKPIAGARVPHSVGSIPRARARFLETVTKRTGNLGAECRRRSAPPSGPRAVAGRRGEGRGGSFLFQMSFLRACDRHSAALPRMRA